MSFSINPIKPGHLGGIKSQGVAGGVEKATPLKTIFRLSKYFEIWFE